MNIFFLILLTTLAGALVAPWLIRRAYRAPRQREYGTPADLGLPYQGVRLPTANGKQLFAWFIPLEEGIAEGPAVAVMHGWGGNAEHMLPFASLLHREGYAVLLLDARNHGNSDADSFSSMPRFAEDLEHGLDWLSRQPRIDPQRLFRKNVPTLGRLQICARCKRAPTPDSSDSRGPGTGTPDSRLDAGVGSRSRASSKKCREAAGAPRIEGFWSYQIRLSARRGSQNSRTSLSHAAQLSASNSACFNIVSVADACLSGG